MTYEETIELEENVKLKNEADKIYQDFRDNVKLDAGKYKGNGKFEFTSDQYNATYFEFCNDSIRYICDFLHENYVVNVSPKGIFTALKSKYRGVEHLKSAVRNKNY